METLEAFSLLQAVPTSIAQVVEAHTVVLQPDGLPPLLFFGKQPTSLLWDDSIQVHKLLKATEVTRTATRSSVKLITFIYG